MGSSGSKTAATPSSESRCSGGSSSSCSCLGLIRTHESHNHLLLLGEEDEGEGEDENKKRHNEQDDESDNTTQQPPPPPPPPPHRSRFSLIPSNFSFRLASSPARIPPPPHPHSSSSHHDPVRFSRTLSVGRLRDRVLRPSPPLLLDHTSDFLERRRRIRSQVRALHSRFHHLSAHHSSCIFTAHCTCTTTNHDTTATPSISRILMLAEALFEVLDEIHQQSVVLSTPSFVSSRGSIPAPKQVVDSMPLKIYTKFHNHHSQDISQCYVCLLEYEEGDCMRILPCDHEFHQTCIDKWLKEIHRVCPLCRGDVCRSADSC